MTPWEFTQRKMTIPREWAEKVWSILERECQAPEIHKYSFLQIAIDEQYPITEFRFTGNLGYGGKFWNTHRAWYVNCYSEDMTDEREEIIYVTNAALHDLFVEFARFKGVEV